MVVVADAMDEACLVELVAHVLDVVLKWLLITDSGLEKKYKESKRYLKRSAVNRLEVQIKKFQRDTFNYPSELAKLHVKNIRPLLLSKRIDLINFLNSLWR